MTPPKETPPKITDVKRDLQAVKEFRIILLKFSKLQKNTGKHLKEIRKTMYKQIKQFDKATKTTKMTITQKSQSRRLH